MNSDNAIKNLPREYPDELLPTIREKFLSADKTIVVLDDDPTGTQTCHDVIVLTSWSVPLITEELQRKPSILFILTNSRSLAAKEAVNLTGEICHNLNEAVRKSGRQIIPISRSDSTLRGHYPAEVDAAGDALGLDDAIRVLIPAFIEGGRFTIDDVHYIVENNEWVPVSETPFARDAAFGYRNANLRNWVEEKSKGAIKASEVHSLSLGTIRIEGPEGVCKSLLQCLPHATCIVNACSYRDLEVVAMGIALAERSGKKFLFRSSATFVSILAGIAPGFIVSSVSNEKSRTGSLVVVGSYVPKTTSQLSHLLENDRFRPVPIEINDVLAPGDRHPSTSAIAKDIDRWIGEGEDVAIFTSRELITGKDAEESLRINRSVSDFLVGIVASLTVRPSFVIAKGGITSSDLASKGLAAEKALVLGQAIPGVPVWRLSPQSKFQDLIYIVFPGNVGDAAALTAVWRKFKQERSGE